MMMPLPETYDKLSIALLKAIRGGQKTGAEVAEYVNYLAETVDSNPDTACVLSMWLSELIRHNNEIWSLESDIRQGKEGGIALEEIGRRAIAIREHNKLRVSVKNDIASKTGSGCVEIKTSHASE